MEPPNLAELADVIKRLEHQCGVVLYLSGLNLFLNCVMLAIGFMLGAR